MTFYTKADHYTDEIIAYYKEHDAEFVEAIEELDSWNGYLGEDRWNDMDYLDDIIKCSSEDAVYWLNRAYYGSDEGGGSFCPNRDYFKFNGYGNLESSDWKEYDDFLDRWAIREMAEELEHIDAIAENGTDELTNLFTSLRKALDEEKEQK